MTRNHKPRSMFALFGVGVLLTLALAACGSSTSSTVAATASTGSGSAATAPATTSASPAATPVGSASPAAGAGSAVVLVANNPKLGAILTNAKGLTLYTYATDAPDKSNCSGKCATNWPPLNSDSTPTAPAGATGTFGTIKRDDGSSQVTYNDKPLYTYIKDDEAGDIYGQDVGDVWYAAQADPGNGTPTADDDSDATPVAATDSDATTLLVAKDAKLGSILTDAKGMTLYTFSKDTAGTSVCYDACATSWPPLTVTGTPSAPDGVSGKLGTTTRKDGTLQVTYNDKPLYLFAGDAKAGDTTGQGVGNVWFIVNP